MTAPGTSPSTPASEGEPWCGTPRLGWFPWFLLVIPAAVVLWVTVAYLSGWSPAGPPGTPTFWWPLFPLGFLLVVVLVWGLSRWAWRRRGPAASGWAPGWGPGYAWGLPDALEVLRVRYARGEISRAQFDEMAAVLERRR